MLKSQCEEVDRLRSVSKQLTTQNEGLLVKVQTCDAINGMQRREPRTLSGLVKTLETHTRDMAKQMAILVQEICPLSGRSRDGTRAPDLLFSEFHHL